MTRTELQSAAVIGLVLAGFLVIFALIPAAAAVQGGFGPRWVSAAIAAGMFIGVWSLVGWTRQTLARAAQATDTAQAGSIAKASSPEPKFRITITKSVAGGDEDDDDDDDERSGPKPLGAALVARIRKQAGNRKISLTVDWESLPRTRLGTGDQLEVVGETNYLDQIRRVDTNVVGGDTWEAVRFTALLVPEPGNPFDRNATAVCVPGAGQVGYIGRASADIVGYLRSELLRTGSAGEVEAKLVGGWGEDRGKVIPPGVIVSIPWAAETPPPEDITLPADWSTRPRVALQGRKPRDINAVGEFPYQARLKGLAAADLAPGQTTPFEAALVPIESTHDEVAFGLAVCAAVGAVGRLSVAAAKRYRALAEALSQNGQIATCQAFVFVEKERFEVKVQLPTPAEAEECVAAAVFQ